MKQPTASSLEPPGAFGNVSNLHVLLPSAPAVLIPAGTSSAPIVAINKPSRSRYLDVELRFRPMPVPPGNKSCPA